MEKSRCEHCGNIQDFNLKNCMKCGEEMADKILGDYRTLVWGIKFAVTAGISVFIEKYPILVPLLKKTEKTFNDWNFFMTVAGICTYITISDVSEKDLREIEKHLLEINNQMPWIEGINDFFKFMGPPEDIDIDKKTKTGWWVLCNIKGKKPTNKESKELAPAIGLFLEKLAEDLAR